LVRGYGSTNVAGESEQNQYHAYRKKHGGDGTHRLPPLKIKYTFEVRKNLNKIL
jgi:hypothetical protein